jgi:hypothetical protein
MKKEIMEQEAAPRKDPHAPKLTEAQRRELARCAAQHPGATFPMNTMVALRKRGLVTRAWILDRMRWIITDAGRAALQSAS